MRHEPDTRRLPRRSLLAGAAVLGLSAATAEAALSPAPAAAENRYSLNGWRFCVNCFGLFLVDYTVERSYCPRTRGAHQAMGWIFQLTYNVSDPGIGEGSKVQSNWRHCYRCAGLYWALTDAPRCPAGGAHAYIRPSSGGPRQFLLTHDVGEPAGTQHQWRYCFKCSVLFYNGYAYRNEYGLCPYDFVWGHTAAGFDFALPVSAY
ncbi:hypothetical protein Sru01_06900 [Sphaerisporangium rufum]|uniref:Tat pathway signal protein n=1 Tax=Sphaerisporangium rufum TaxID=1381558 RepID=A0A919QXL5_9ACTN|nr:hypothetical protein [Sphaerisporangium rufum]GII75708.1 hypothetical protein Sru01_06900 [Sphaerisporangium rufum]